MSFQVLLVDDSEEFRQLAAQFLAIEWPDVEVDEWDPRAQGEIPEFFSLHDYDVLLLDHELGLGNGLSWLQRLIAREDCPPVVFLLETDDQKVITAANERGAFECLLKRDLSRAQLAAIVTAAAEVRAARFVPNERTQLASNEHSDKAVLNAQAPLDKRDTVMINGYRMVEKIGSGGMSAVYLAERASDGLRLVMKIMDARLVDNNEFLARFIQEYGLLSKLDCPQVVRIYDQGVTDGHVYIAMEHFAGGALRQRIRSGLSPTDTVDILCDIARALKEVHEHGIVHRDLKPDNVMFRLDGTLALVDFGIATTNSAGADLTVRGDVLGTPHYLSPEQARGWPLDGRSDLYSLGIVFFEMLTGRRPFRAKDAMELAQKHVKEPLPRLPTQLGHYQELIDCLTAKRPDDRFASASALLTYVAANIDRLRGDSGQTAMKGREVASVACPARCEDIVLACSTAPEPVGLQPYGEPRRLASGSRPAQPATVRHTNTPLLPSSQEPSDVLDASRTLQKDGPAILTLLAEALNDGNLHFVYEAARLLKITIATLKVPVVLDSIVNLERYAQKSDGTAAAAAFLSANTLVRRLISELTEQI